MNPGLILKSLFWEEFQRAESTLTGPGEMRNSSQQMIPETEPQSDNIMKHNTDSWGDLEVKDDGPY